MVLSACRIKLVGLRNIMRISLQRWCGVCVGGIWSGLRRRQKMPAVCVYEQAGMRKII